MSTDELNIVNKQVVGGVYNNVTPKGIKVNEYGSIVLGSGIVESDLLNDAWGRIKAMHDYSIFHGMWTLNVHGLIRKGKEDGAEVLDLSSSTRIVSTNGNLVLTTTAVNGSDTDLISFRSPRYQPNRGHLFSTSIFYDDCETIGATARWGLGVFDGGDIDTGVYFEITDGVLYAVVINEGVERFKTDITALAESITGRTLASLCFGSLYDIQFQWRGAGDYFFFIDQKLVYRHNFLGTTTEVTMSNPQLPCFFEVKNVSAGAICTLKVGCIDITSEGGKQGALTDASFSNEGLITVSGASGLPRAPLAIFRVESTLNGKINTRNLRLLRVTSSAYTRACKIGFAFTRDATAITLGTGVFSPVNPYSSLSVIDMTAEAPSTPGVTPTTTVDFSKTTISYKATIPAENTWEANEPNPDLDFYASPGDYIIVFARQVKTGTDAEADCTVEFGEEI